MPEHQNNHAISYKTYGFVLIGLVIFTLISVGVTQIYLGPLSVAVALLLAVLKTTLVLMYFMHLKFERRTYRGFVIFVLLLYVAVIVITMLDYLFRIA